MKKDLPQVEIQPVHHKSASEIVHEFFIANNIVPNVTSVNELNSWVGDGYVLNDKPLLKITYEFKG